MAGSCHRADADCCGSRNDRRSIRQTSLSTVGWPKPCTFPVAWGQWTATSIARTYHREAAHERTPTPGTGVGSPPPLPLSARVLLCRRRFVGARGDPLIRLALAGLLFIVTLPVVVRLCRMLPFWLGLGRNRGVLLLRVARRLLLRMPVFLPLFLSGF